MRWFVPYTTTPSNKTHLVQLSLPRIPTSSPLSLPTLSLDDIKPQVTLLPVHLARYDEGLVLVPPVPIGIVQDFYEEGAHFVEGEGL